MRRVNVQFPNELVPPDLSVTAFCLVVFATTAVCVSYTIQYDMLYL